MRMILLMYIPLIPLTPSPAGLLHTKNSFSRKKIACCEPCELDYLEYFNQEKLIFTKKHSNKISASISNDLPIALNGTSLNH